MEGSSNLIYVTLSRALGGMWDLFWPVLLPFLFLLLVAFAAYIYRKVTNVG